MVQLQKAIFVITLIVSGCAHRSDQVALPRPVPLPTAGAAGLEPGCVVTDVGSVKGFVMEMLPGLLPEGVEFVPGDPLAVWSLDAEWSRMSDRIDWRYSLGWLQERRKLLTPRAYAAYLLTWLGGASARAGERSAFLPLLREAWRHGRPAWIDLLSFFGYWGVPRGLQSRLAARFARRSQTSEPD